MKSAVLEWSQSTWLLLGIAPIILFSFRLVSPSALIRHRAVTLANYDFVREVRMKAKISQYKIICTLIWSFQIKTCTACQE